MLVALLIDGAESGSSKSIDLTSLILSVSSFLDATATNEYFPVALGINSTSPEVPLAETVSLLTTAPVLSFIETTN